MRARQALMFLVAAIFATAGLLGFYFNPVPSSVVFAGLSGFLAGFAVLRFWRLALAAALAPLPGIFWFGSSAYALCLALAILMAAAYADAVLKEKNRLDALRQPALALAGVLVFSLLWSLHEAVRLPSLLAGSLSTLLFFPALAFQVPFGELDIARGNRQREALQPYGVFAARLAEPRWCLSLSGVGMVLAVIGYFRLAARPVPFDGLAALAAAILVLALSRDVRAAIGALLAAALLIWFCAGVTGAMLLFLLLALLLAGEAAQWRGAGESVTLAWSRTLEDHVAGILFAGLAAALAAALRDGAMAGARALYALSAALILFPAFTGALHHIFPRRRSVEELYRSSVS